MGLCKQILITRESLANVIHVTACTVIGAFHARHAAQSDHGTANPARIAIVGSSVSVHIDAACSVVARAGYFIGARTARGLLSRALVTRHNAQGLNLLVRDWPAALAPEMCLMRDMSCLRQIGIAMKRLLDGVHMTASAVVAPLHSGHAIQSNASAGFAASVAFVLCPVAINVDSTGPIAPRTDDTI